MITGPANTTGRVDDTFFYIVGVSVILLVVVTACMIYFLIRYNRKRHPQPETIPEKLWLEVVWTVIPIVLALSMFYSGWINFKYIRTPADNGMTIKVFARKWTWLFVYDNNKQSDQLRVPVNEPVTLKMTSMDVIHSLYIPAFRIKEDVVPGLKTHLSFRATELGTYDLFCTEYCGLGHSHMLSKVVVMPADEFKSWLNATDVGGPPAKGLKIMEAKGCTGCHSLDGTTKIGPTFKGLYGSQQTVITKGEERSVTVDEGFIRAYVLTPNSDIIKGYQPIMPVIPVSDEEMNDIVEYIKTLK
jgi:cytochrome c oxidase subunit II